MAEYIVTWDVNLEADTPLDAARLALAMQRDPESTADVFNVRVYGQPVDSTVVVDLHGPEARLEYLRAQIEAECISLGEMAELQDLAPHIQPGDTVLLEWAGIPEYPEGPADTAGGDVLLRMTAHGYEMRCGKCGQTYMGDAPDETHCDCRFV